MKNISKMKYIIICIITLFTFAESVTAQNPQWIVYTTQNSGLPGNHITALAYENNGVMWIGTGFGLVEFDWTNWTVYDTSNSPLPHNVVWSLAVDNYGNKWIGTPGAGLAYLKHDGISWTVYNTSNSPLPSNNIFSIVVDQNNVKWIGASGGLAVFNDTNWIIYDSTNSGLQRSAIWALALEDHVKWIGSYSDGVISFNDTTWTVYNYLNSGLPSNYIEGICVDRISNKWIATRFGGLAKFNSISNNWTVYNTSNSSLPENNLNCVVVDTNNIKYIGPYFSGLVIYNDTSWTIHNTSNSPIPSNSISCITIDSNNNKWLGTGGGLAIYNENGVVSVENKYTQISEDFVLYQNFPNPFNPKTKISFSIQKYELVILKIYDALGHEISELINQGLQRGLYEYEWNGANYSSGVYFYSIEINDFRDSKKMLLIK